MSEVDDLEVPCLQCRADEGEPCLNGYGGRTTHAIRVATAELKAAGVL